jgi:hypothetical protein
MPFSWPLAS